MVAPSIVRAIATFLGGSRGERAFFDAAYYRATYADIAATGVDPYAHFSAHGWREGRNPSAMFNTLFYRDYHLAGAAIDPLKHWISSGAGASGLATVPPMPDSFVALQRAVVAEHFDVASYLLRGGATAADPIAHYLAGAWRDGISPNTGFDPTRYGEENRFVETLGVSPFYHWCSQLGLRGAGDAPAVAATAPPIAYDELARVIAPEFDGKHYLLRQADVRKAKLDPLKHYLEHGWRERRDPHPLFDSFFYLERYRDVATARIDPFYHYLTIGRPEGRRSNPVGMHLYPPMRAPTDWSRCRPAADVAGSPWIVVIPVYRGIDETLAAIHAVLSARQTTPFALHVVNDRSPEAPLVAELQRLAGEALFSFETNATNLGFVKTCNAALRRFADKEVVLLNADALVHGDWLDRMAGHADRDPTIATITPLSNNATICSYPVNNANNLIEPEVDAATLDKLAAAANAARTSDLPTGVGFCFFMSRASREAIGLFDEVAFGRGYGEENDFCLRAAKAGFRNVLAEDIFVYHRGEVSFAEAAAAEYGPGQKALHGKHPDYLARVDQHLRADPGLHGRMRLDMKRLARFAGPRTIVFVSHALAGGIVTHIAHLEERLRAEGVSVVHLRVGVGNRWSVELCSDARDTPFLPNLAPTSIHQIGDLLGEFLDWLSPIAIHFHSLVGFDWRATGALFDIVRGTGVPYVFTLHDYSVVCHRNDLVLTDGRYCGLPPVDTCRACVSGDRSYPEALDPATRREAYDRFLRGAAAVFAPSDDIATRLLAAGAGYPIEVRPHEDPDLALPRIPAPATDAACLDIVTIGAVGAHKGSRVLQSLARDALARDLPIRFHIVGHSDMTEEMKGLGVVETGRYDDDEEAAVRVAAIRPAFILLPSIWPETFCYTLSLAFRLGVPPVVFDVGAQADRVRQAGFGIVLPLAMTDDPGGLNDRLLALPRERTASPPSPTVDAYPTMLRDYYGFVGEDVAAA